MELEQGRNLYNRFFTHFTGIMGQLSVEIIKFDIILNLTPETVINFSEGDEISIYTTSSDEPIPLEEKQ